MRYRFGDYTLDTQCYELCRAGQRVPLRRKVFQILAYLLTHRDQVMSKEELIAHGWPGQFLSEETLSSCITAARQAVGDSGAQQAVIQTRRGYGYRFVAVVEEDGPGPGAHAAVLGFPAPAPSVMPTLPGMGLLPCAACQYLNPPASQVCGACGLWLGTGGYPEVPDPRPMVPGLQAAPVPPGGRKQVTVLAGALVPTPAPATLDPEVWDTLRRQFFRLAQQAVQQYAGTLQQIGDDDFLALFGTPTAQEDHAQRAVLAALRLQRAVRHPGTDLACVPGVDLAVQIGVHTGQVLVGPLTDGHPLLALAVGDTIRVAARLRHLATPGTLLLSATTRPWVHGVVYGETVTQGPGASPEAPLLAYEVLQVAPQAFPWPHGRARSPFVGRDRELAMLQAVVAQVEVGHGHVVGLVGDPGMGKSRLLYEFQRQVAARSLTLLIGGCVSYGQATPYLPLRACLRQAWELAETDPPAVLTTTVAARLQHLALAPETWVPPLLALLGVEPETDQWAALSAPQRRTQTFEALLHVILHTSRQRPLVLAIENLHWIDPTSEAWLVLLAERLAGAPLLLLTTTRPGYRPPWMDKSYATQLALRSLAPPEALTVVRTMRPDATLPAHLEQTIVEKAEGNPFFLEELTRAVLDHGALQTVGSVPDTIQGVLSARIDRLPTDHKRLVQTTAVLGREFARSLLEALWDDEPVDPLLVALQRLEFLYERTGADEPTYVFKHALTQEVAYESLLTARRQALHAAAGHVLEQRSADRLDEVADRLGYHYARTDNAVKAVEYLTRVAERAARGFAHTEALTALEEALVHAERLPIDTRDQRVVALWTRQLDSLLWVGHRQEAIALHRERQARVDRLENHALVGRYYVWLIILYGFLGERDQAVQSAQRVLAEAQHCQDDVLMGMAYAWLCAEDFFAGRLLQAVEPGRRAVALLEGTAERYWLGTANYMLALSYYYVGEFGWALEAATRVEAIADTIGDRRLQTNAAGVRGWSLATRGDWEAGIAACQGALERAPDPFETALVVGFLGHAYLEQGNLAAAIPVLEQAVEEANRYRSRQTQSWFKAFLGEAYRLDQQLDKAQHVASQGYELASSTQNGWGAALAQRTLGRLAHTHGRLAEAEALLQEALDTFAAIHAQFEAGRTYLDLAALAHVRGNQAGATAHLTQAQALFTTLQVPRYVERTAHLARTSGGDAGAA